MSKKTLFYTITFGAILALGAGLFSLNLVAKTATNNETTSSQQQERIDGDGASTWHNEDCYNRHGMEGHEHIQDCYDENGNLKDYPTRTNQNDSSSRMNRRGGRGHMRDGHMRGMRGNGFGNCH